MTNQEKSNAAATTASTNAAATAAAAKTVSTNTAATTTTGTAPSDNQADADAVNTNPGATSNTAPSPTADRELTLSRILPAPIDLVWEAWSQPEHIASWWGPNGFSTTIHVMEFRPNGEWNLVMHGPDGTDYDNKSIFTEIIPFKKIAYQHLTWPNFLTTVEFEDLGEATRITWHMLFDSPETFIQVVQLHKADQGLQQNADKLITYLAKMK